MAGWTVWKRLAFAEELAWGNISGKPTSLSGYGITDGVNAVSVTGSGNAVTAASVSGHTLTLTKGSTFSLSNHTHYVGTTQVQGSSAEQALTGITKIDNILKLSKATVTVNTSYKAEQNRLVKVIFVPLFDTLVTALPEPVVSMLVALPPSKVEILPMAAFNELLSTAME
jgi:hypothetical protein